MDLLSLAKNVADKVEAKAVETKVPVAVCVTDIHGNIVLKHRMGGAPAFSIDIAERKVYTSALVGMRTADLFALVQPGQPLFALVGLSGASQAAGTLPCDLYGVAGTPCVAAHSTTRALYASYNGPLYQVMRQSDGKKLNIGVVKASGSDAGGYADAARSAHAAASALWRS